MKKCTKCQEIKALIEFGKRSSREDGLDYTCKPCKAEMNAQYRNDNRAKKSETDKNWRKNNKEHQKSYFAEYKRNQRQTDLSARLKNNLQRRLHKALKGQAKSDKTMSILGTDIDGLKSHIESRFQPGMTWENYGQWHMDHRIPLASAGSLRDIEMLFHYSNLQPLWALDNIKKSDKLEGNQ